MHVRRDKTAHRRRLCCDACDHSEPLPIDGQLRLQGWPELPLFETEEA
jgi:hypothetical protein